MLSRVRIQNFKSIGEPGVDLELKPLTFLVGPNGGGKSSILEAIGATAKRHSGGQLIDYDKLEAFIHRGNGLEATIELYFKERGTTGAFLGGRITLPSKNFEELEGPHLHPQSEEARTTLQGLWYDHLSRTFLISSVRGDVRFDTGTGQVPAWIGLHGEYLLSALGLVLGPEGNDESAKSIVGWARRFGISGLKAGLSGSDKVGSSYVEEQLGTRLNSALSSSGARQILTVITQLFWAAKGSLVMIEEPEISLHPKAQLDVLQMFAEAIREDKQIITTSHSMFMMQGLGYAVHKGWLESDQIAVYHVQKQEGGTEASRLPLGENGYIEGWIPSYTEIERQMLLEWAETLPRE